MGWGAAQAFYEENKSWLDSPEDAYECLYGKPKTEKRPSSKSHVCAKCEKRFRKQYSLTQHMRDAHDQTEED